MRRNRNLVFTHPCVPQVLKTSVPRPNASLNPFFSGRVSNNTPRNNPPVSNTPQILSYELTGGDEILISGTSFLMGSA